MAKCNNVTATKGKNPVLGAKAQILYAEVCCPDSVLAVKVGVAAVAAVDPGAHGRMKKFSDELAQAHYDGELLEYSLLVWGLTDKQLVSLRKEAVRIASEPDDAP